MKLFRRLPQGWALSNLGRLSTLVQYGLTARAEADSKGILYLRISDISEDGEIDLDNAKYVPNEVAQLNKYQLEPGDIVIARSGTTGRSFVYKGSDEPWVFASYLIRFRPDQRIIEPEYLGYYMRSVYYWHYIQAMTRTVAQPNINSKELRGLEIPVPPLPEQHRILDILRQANNVRTLRRQANLRARDLLPALFLEIFGEPGRWEATAPLEEFATFVGGGTPSRKVEKYFQGTIPWATSKDVKARYLHDAQEHITQEAIENSATKPVPAGTILMVVKSKILVHSLPMGITTQPFCFGQDLKGLICNDKVSPHFVFSAIQAQAPYVLGRARGVNTEGLTLEILRSIPIPVVSPDLQEAFVQRVRVFDSLEESSLLAEEKHRTLFASLLALAFTGELGAVWREARTDELQEAAAERDGLLGLKERRVVPSALNISTESGREAFEAKLQSIMEPVSKQLAASVSSASALVESLQSGPLAELGQQMQQVAERNQALVDASIWRSMQEVTDHVRQSLAMSLEPLRQAVASITQMGGLQDAIQRLSLQWAEQLAQTAAAVLRRPDPSHPRYALLSELSDAQYLTYLAVKSAPSYVRADSLTDDMGLSAKRLELDLSLLATAGLIQAISILVQPPDGSAPRYVQAYRPLADTEDSRADDLAHLQGLAL